MIGYRDAKASFLYVCLSTGQDPVAGVKERIFLLPGRQEVLYAYTSRNFRCIWVVNRRFFDDRPFYIAFSALQA